MKTTPLSCSLPMYDWPEQQAANDALWQEIRKVLRKVDVETTEDLVRGDAAFELMYSPTMLFTQTCGLPLRTVHENKVTTFAAPHYDVEGGGVGTYSSAIILRKDDTATSLGDTKDYTFAFNSLGSQSGYSALRYHMKSKGLGEQHFATELKSGSHRDTVLAVAEGRAQIGAVDSLCWDLVKEVVPEAVSNLRILEWTQTNPAMPFVINEHSQFSADEVFDILDLAISNLPERTRTKLRFKGLKKCDNSFFYPIKQQFNACKDFQMSRTCE